MRILFLDLSPRSYTTQTGMVEPLGGTQAAVAGLSKALVKRGHAVTVVNGVDPGVVVDGVDFRSSGDPVRVDEFDVVVPVSVPLGRKLKGMGCKRPIVLWEHHDANQPACFNLGTAEEKETYAGFVFVSDWQNERYRETFRIFDGHVIRNGVSEPFLNVEMRAHEGMVLGYSSTPYRGLDVLLLAFSVIRREMPDVRLKIFSSMAIYGEVDPYECLYETARKLDGVEYIGAVSQVRLADELAGVDYWTYPSTFPETSCIAAMEAMAAGCRVITTDLGAMRETVGAYGALQELKPDILPLIAGRYAAHVINSMRDGVWKEGAIAYAQGMNWDVRAAEWEKYLNERV